MQKQLIQLQGLPVASADAAMMRALQRAVSAAMLADVPAGDLGVSQTRVAEAASLSQSLVSRVLRKDGATLNIGSLMRLLVSMEPRLECTAEELLMRLLSEWRRGGNVRG